MAGGDPVLGPVPMQGRIGRQRAELLLERMAQRQHGGAVTWRPRDGFTCYVIGFRALQSSNTGSAMAWALQSAAEMLNSPHTMIVFVSLP